MSLNSDETKFMGLNWGVSVIKSLVEEGEVFKFTDPRHLSSFRDIRDIMAGHTLILSPEAEKECPYQWCPDCATYHSMESDCVMRTGHV